MYVFIVIEPNGKITKTEQAKKPEYKQIREAVGGIIQIVPHLSKFEEYKRGTAYCHEEGLLIGLAFNEKATQVWLDNLGKGPFSYPPRIVGNLLYIAKKVK